MTQKLLVDLCHGNETVFFFNILVEGTNSNEKMFPYAGTMSVRYKVNCSKAKHESNLTNGEKE